MEAQHMNQQAFAACTGISSASLSSIFTGRTKPTLNHVDAILAKFSKVNPLWLLQGVGGMMIEDGLPANSQGTDATPFNLADGTPAVNPGNGTSGASGAIAGDLFSSANVSEQSVAANPANSYNSSQNNGNGRGASLSQGASYNGNRYNNMGRSGNAPTIAVEASGAMRKITEIRVFYDDQTWESFVPKK